MKTKSLLAMAVAPMILGMPLASMAESVTTDPVGFVKINIAPGLQTVGLPMVKPAVAAGLVASSDSASVTMASDVGTLPSGAYYLEVVSGSENAPWVGERFDVVGSSGSVVSIDASSVRNTISLSTVDLSGYSVVVRPHITLNDAFPAGEMTEGDQVLLFDSSTGGFGVVSLDHDIFSGELAWGENVILAPGVGLFYLSNASAEMDIINLGEVRMNTFRQPLVAGLNFVSEGHPVDNSPDSRFLTAANGFEANDQIFVFDRSSGGYSVFSLEEDIFSGELAWNVPGADPTVFKANATTFILKGSADLNYEAPRTF